MLVEDFEPFVRRMLSSAWFDAQECSRRWKLQQRESAIALLNRMYANIYSLQVFQANNKLYETDEDYTSVIEAFLLFGKEVMDYYVKQEHGTDTSFNLQDLGKLYLGSRFNPENQPKELLPQI